MRKYKKEIASNFFEKPKGFLTSSQAWRVYQFRHPGNPISGRKFSIGKRSRYWTCGFGYLECFNGLAVGVARLILIVVVFDCRMENDPATSNTESTNENNTDVDRWADCRGLWINGKPWGCINLPVRLAGSR